MVYNVLYDNCNNMRKNRNLSSKIIVVVRAILIITGIIGVLTQRVTAISEFNDVDTLYADYTDQLSSSEQLIPEVLTDAVPEAFPAKMPDATVLTFVEQTAARIKAPLDTSRYLIHIPGRADLENPAIPIRIEIPRIELDAPVITADYASTKVEGKPYGQWQPPNFFASAWHPDSALLGEPGNTVINGHHNVFGEVFKQLVELEVGDTIFVYSEEKSFEFVIVNRLILEDTFMDATTRLENARWLAYSDDVRLTLVTCWPLTSFTHRLILVASPVPAH